MVRTEFRDNGGVAVIAETTDGKPCLLGVRMPTAGGDLVDKACQSPLVDRRDGLFEAGGPTLIRGYHMGMAPRRRVVLNDTVDDILAAFKEADIRPPRVRRSVCSHVASRFSALARRIPFPRFKTGKSSEARLNP